MENEDNEIIEPLHIKSILVLFSYHHKNTEKIAKVISRVLDAKIKTPLQVSPSELKEYDLVGFGSGIYSDKHHNTLLDLADKLPHVNNKKAFIFSTCGAPAFAVDGGHVDEYLVKVHSSLKEKLHSKGYIIVDEFICTGWNTNKFLKLFGGVNKGRPNAKDLKHAEEFAKNLIQKMT
jgi:flavodoxin